MLKDNSLEQQIHAKVIELNKLERMNHQSSGLLTASMLGWPLQWQILKVAGVSSKESDAYSLLKFMRGDDVEERIVGLCDNVIAKQFKGMYRNVLCYTDALIKYTGNIPQLQGLTLPHEFKSVANSKFTRIVGTKTKPGNGPDHHHILQACLEALTINSPYFVIDYVASDDYRIDTTIFETAEFVKEVDEIINKFDNALKEFKLTGKIPEFQARYDWQKNLQYNNYPEWMEKDENSLRELYESISLKN